MEACMALSGLATTTVYAQAALNSDNSEPGAMTTPHHEAASPAHAHHGRELRRITAAARARINARRLARRRARRAARRRARRAARIAARRAARRNPVTDPPEVESPGWAPEIGQT